MTTTEPTPQPDPQPEPAPEPQSAPPFDQDRPDGDDLGDGAQSHDTSGPGGDVDPRDDPEEGPSSHETVTGTDPAAQVRATFDE